MRLVLISDTHGQHRAVQVPAGDVLIHAGDLTHHGDLTSLRDFDEWLGSLPHPHKLVIAGNHDFCFEREPAAAAASLTRATYLFDSAVTIDGVRFYGTPWQPWFMDWAFNLPRGAALRARWDLIPTNTDVLITHTPPWGILDWSEAANGPVGCEELAPAVRRLKPRLHVFGHIHEAMGRLRQGATTYVNASICDLGYRPVNTPFIIDFDTLEGEAPRA